MLELLIFILMVSFLFVAFVDPARDEGPGRNRRADSLPGYLVFDSAASVVVNTLYRVSDPVHPVPLEDSVYLEHPGSGYPECVRRRIEDGDTIYPEVLQVTIDSDSVWVEPGRGWRSSARARRVLFLDTLVQDNTVSTRRFWRLSDRAAAVVKSDDPDRNPFRGPCNLYAEVEFELSPYSRTLGDSIGHWQVKIEDRFYIANPGHWNEVAKERCQAFEDVEACLTAKVGR